MIRLVGLLLGLGLSVFGLSLQWLNFPKEQISSTGFEALNLASAFLVVLALGVFMLFYFKKLAQRVISGVLALVSGYLLFISANSLLNAGPIIDRLVSVTGAVGTSPEVEFNSGFIAVYFVGLSIYLLTLVFNIIRPRQSAGSKRITKSTDGDDPIGLWDSQS
jgi:hypothetical protein